MTSQHETTPYDVDGAEVARAVEDHHGPVVVDFDETLFLTNSTALFISSVRPALLAYLIIKVLDVVKPWRWTGGSVTRDVWRVRALRLLLPWTGPHWRRICPKMAASWTNEDLAGALRRRDDPVIVSTLGFTPIVEPLLGEMGLNAKLVSMDVSSKSRRRGKVEPTAEAAEPSRLEDCLVVTDSTDDLELLDSARVPLRVLWPNAHPTELFPTMYYPTRYLTVVKRPGTNYVRKILKEDVALWILGSIWLARSPITHVVGLLLLAASFWAVYEYGYVDNDRSGNLYEKHPKLSEAFHDGKVVVHFWQPAVWALVCGVIGLWVLRYPARPSAAGYLAWLGALGVTAGVFWIYNRIDKQARVLLFPLLQVLRLGSFVLLVPVPAVTSLAILAQVIVRSFNYYSYRVRGEGWPEDDPSAVRFVVFTSVVLLIAAGDSWSLLTDATTVCLLVWQLFLARHTLPAAVRQVRRIDRQQTSQPSM